MGSASRRWALNIVIRAYGDELRDEVAQTLPKIVKLVLEGIELRPGDMELLADAVIIDIDGTEARLGVASRSPSTNWPIVTRTCTWPGRKAAALMMWSCLRTTIHPMITPKRYRLGQDFRDLGSVRNTDDQFLGWINVPGSGMRNRGGIRPLRFVSLDELVPAAIVLVTDERSAGSASNPWDDLVDVWHGRIVYWGDAKFDAKRTVDDNNTKLTIINIISILTIFNLY